MDICVENYLERKGKKLQIREKNKFGTLGQVFFILAAKTPFQKLKMYTLMSGLWKSLTQKDEYFIIILGLDNAGKTTFLESAKAQFTADYKQVNPAKITATVGLNIGKIDTQGVR